MNKKLFLSLLPLMACNYLSSQKNEPVIVKINGNPTTKSEFEYIYNKNNSSENNKRESLKNYLELFTTYKLKVEEAKAQKLDTASSFRKEYLGYKAQLAAPYLQDTVSEEVLAKKYYDRLNVNFEVSHILIPFPKKVLLPADTLEVYNKALDVWKKLIVSSNLLSFEEAATSFSADHSGTRPGYIGWITANTLVAPFENAIYNMAVGSISSPVRTNFGYHIILLHNKRKDPGQMKVAHIMFGTNSKMTTQQDDSVRNEANKIYQRLLAGEEYAKLAKEYSFDKYSSENGGEIGWVNIGVRLPADWLEACVSLANVNDFSKPIKTIYGYHIIKLLDKKPREPFSVMKKEMVNYMKTGEHKSELETRKIEKLRKEIKTETDKNSYAILSELSKTKFPTDSTFLTETSKLKQPLLRVEKNVYTVNDFLSFLKTEASRPGDLSTEYFNSHFNSFLLNKMLETKEQNLVNKHPEFKNLINEYFDGILLFDIMNKEVWQKAEKDTIGLSKFFADNRTKYTWNKPRYKGYVIHCKDEATMNKAKEIISQNKGNKELTKLLYSLNDSISKVVVERGTWGEGENSYIDKEIYKKDVKKEMRGYPFFFVETRTITAPEDYKDVNAQIVADYQDVLEKRWVESLRKKYKVEINQKALDTIK